MHARPFIFHEPRTAYDDVEELSPLDTTIGLSSVGGFNRYSANASSTATTNSRRRGSGVALDGGGSTAEVPWNEVASSIIADPKEKAAALIMLHRSPLEGTAIPCTITVHNDKVLEITLATHRTGVLPLDPTSALHPTSSTLDRLQRRRVVIPVSSIASIGSDLPPPSFPGDGGSATNSLDYSPTMMSSLTNSTELTAAQPLSYGYEISGSPMRALRIVLHIHHDPTQRSSDWFGGSLKPNPHTSGRLRPRVVVFYATSLNDANTWRANLRRICQSNLTEALGRANWNVLGDQQAAAEAQHGVDNVLRQVMATHGDGTTRTVSQTTDSYSPAAESIRGADPCTLEPSAAPTATFLKWFTTRHLQSIAHESRRIKPSSLRMAVRLKDCTGYGVWCQYGHKWLSEIQDTVRLEALTRVEAHAMPIMEEVEDDTMISDVAPWIVLQRCSHAALHPNIVHSQAMRRDLLWRLSCLRHQNLSSHQRVDDPSPAVDDDISWLDARGRFMAPEYYERYTAQKYIDVEGAMGDVIDSIADRMSRVTGIAF